MAESMRDQLVIRPERPADFDRIRDVVAAAFGSDVEADLVDRIRASAEFVPQMALVAERVDQPVAQIVGHVMISGAVIRHAAGERRIVMLSPLAVAPDHQRLGIGGALVRSATALADHFGEPLVVLEGSPLYYPRFGFEPAARYGITIDLPDWAPPDAAQVLLLSGYDGTDPTLRGTVVYPPAFDAVE
jgi:putative acetyltransferase